VFDGRPRSEKQPVIEHRKNFRDKVYQRIDDIIDNNIKLEDYETIKQLSKKIRKIKMIHIIEAKKLFDTFGVGYIHIENIEADAVFKYLLDTNIVDACFSGDMDTLAYGCKLILQDLDFRNDLITEINYAKLLQSLGVNYEQMQMALILSGTDWNNSLRRSSFTNNVNLIKKYGNIQNIINCLDEINSKLEEQKQLSIPIRFNWEFSQRVFNEEFTIDIINKINISIEENIQKTNNILTTEKSYQSMND
jgi:5'-3' exonuclease